MKHKFGIIGLGMIAEMHAKAIQDIPEAEVVACFDVNGERAKEFCVTYGGTPYVDLDRFLASDEFDIVTICTPSGLHMESAVAAANAKKHIIVEKPLEITVERCDAIIEAAKKHNVVLSGIFPSRFHSVSQVVKQAIETRRLGPVVLGDAYVKWYRSQAYYDSSGWKGTWKFDGGGALMNQSIHAIDLLQWFMGPVTQVTAYAGTLAHENIEVEDTAVAVLKFANGALGVIEGTTGAYPGFYKRIELSGSKGSVILEEENLTMWKFAEESPQDEKIRSDFAALTATGGGAADPTAIGYHGHMLQFMDVIEAIDNGTQPLIDGTEARKAVEIIQAIYRSAQIGAPVDVPLKRQG
jgi:predicted dehydrogenase